MKFILYLSTLFISVCCVAQIPKVNGGKIQRLAAFKSAYVISRNIDVWLPDQYDTSRKYPVLYMQDGQMLFDSSINWNKQEWKVDETITSLINSNTINACIVVGIWNTGLTRHSEYFPEKPIEFLAADVKDSLLKQELAGKAQADNYLLFMVKELKPYIDSHFSTLPDQAHTFIAGSSLGGLISIYAICEYPEIFHGAACMSTHWPGSLKHDINFSVAMNAYLLKHLPSASDHQLYFDYGNKTLDSLYRPFQIKVNKIMQLKGYTSKNWMTKEFPGEEHSEKAWARRFNIPLKFLLGK